MTHKAMLFLKANASSPVEYAAAEIDGCFYRLASGRTFQLSAKECRQVGRPYWAYDRELVAA